MMVSRVAINNVEILNFVKNMFGSICRENTRNARIKTTAENSPSSARAVTEMMISMSVRSHNRFIFITPYQRKA